MDHQDLESNKYKDLESNAEKSKVNRSSPRKEAD